MKMIKKTEIFNISQISSENLEKSPKIYQNRTKTKNPLEILLKSYILSKNPKNSEIFYIYWKCY